MTETGNRVNNGVILRPGPPDKPRNRRTFIVSGIGRGGTTLVAAVLRAAGVPMGEKFHEAAVEDKEVEFVLRQSDRRHLDELIALKNRQYPNWGFKIPNIHGMLRSSEVARFRNPHLILVFRDPLAIALRRTLSDYQESERMLIETTSSMHNLVQFFNHTTCPALLLSYEKALVFPDTFIRSVMEFCGLRYDTKMHEQLLRQVIPNSPEYIAGTTVKIVGYVEALRDNTLFGWCAYANFMGSVELDLFINDTKVSTFTAQAHRPDLMLIGYNNGNSGFEVDLSGITLTPADRLHVRLSQRPLFELTNSGLTVTEYQQVR